MHSSRCAPSTSSASMRTMSGRSSARALRYEGDKVVFAQALEHQEGGRGLAGVRDQMRPARRDAVGLARLELHLFLGILHEDSDAALEHVERVSHARVVMPRHLLRLRDLQLVDPEPGALGV